MVTGCLITAERLLANDEDEVEMCVHNHLLKPDKVTVTCAGTKMRTRAKTETNGLRTICPARLSSCPSFRCWSVVVLFHVFIGSCRTIPAEMSGAEDIVR